MSGIALSSVRCFLAAKAGSAAEAECEDAAQASEGGGVPRRIAVADGASASYASGTWASLLCDAYAKGELNPDTWQDVLPDLGRCWYQREMAQSLPWYAQERARTGAFAALCGLTITEEGTWSAMAVGDSCLFQVREKERLVIAFPLARAEDFSTTPALVGALPAANVSLAAHIRQMAGTAAPGDTFYLMSDALAAWFVRTHAVGRQPWRWLESLGLSHAPLTFPDLLAQLREDQGLVNDDTVLAIVSVTAAATVAEGA